MPYEKRIDILQKILAFCEESVVSENCGEEAESDNGSRLALNAIAYYAGELLRKEKRKYGRTNKLGSYRCSYTSDMFIDLGTGNIAESEEENKV